MPMNQRITTKATTKEMTKPRAMPPAPTEPRSWRFLNSSSEVAPEEAHDNGEEGAPVDHDDGEDRAELDDDVEHLPVILVIAQQGTGEDQMAGRGDRQEFGDPLDDAEQDDGEDRAHAAPSGQEG